MKRSDQINDLAKSLSAAQQKFTPVKKTKTATVKGVNKAGQAIEYTYNYADLSDILAMALPILAAEGLSLVQSPERREGGLVAVETTLFHSSGQWLSSEFPVKVDEQERLSWIQGAGSAITYIRRYAASGMLGLSSEDDDDGQAAGIRHQATANASGAAQTSSATSGSAQARPAQAAPAPQGGRPAQNVQQRSQRPAPRQATPDEARRVNDLLLILDNAFKAGELNEVVYKTWLDKLTWPNGAFKVENLNAIEQTITHQWGNFRGEAPASVHNSADQGYPPDGTEEPITPENMFEDPDVPGF